MYKSPIELIYEDIQYQVEEGIYKAVQEIGVKIDKAGLIRAVEADRKVHEGKLVEVIRCKDCEHYNAGFECLKEGYGIERDKDYYCGDGKRREKNGNGL